MMDVVVPIAFAVLSVAAAMCLARIVIGPSLPERIVASDTLLLVVVAGLGVEIAESGSGVNVTVLVVVALVGFIGTSFLARFVEARGSDDG